jgi:hypothetical protein
MIAAAAIAWTATKPAKAFMRRDPSGPPGSRESGKSTFSPVYPASASSSPARPPLPILSLPGRQFVLTTIHRCCCCGCSLLLLYCCGCAAARDDTIPCGIRLLLLLTCAAPARRYRRWAPRHRRPAAWATCVAARVATRVTNKACTAVLEYYRGARGCRACRPVLARDRDPYSSTWLWL